MNSVVEIQKCIEDKDSFIIFMDYVGLYTLENKIVIQKKRIFSLFEAIEIMKPIICGLLKIGNFDKYVYSLKPNQLYLEGDQKLPTNIVLGEPTCLERFKKPFKMTGNEYLKIFINEPI